MAKLTKKDPTIKTLFQRKRYKKDVSEEKQYKGKDKGILSIKKKGQDIKITKRGNKKKLTLISPAKRRTLKFQLVKSKRAPLNPKNLPKLPKISLFKSPFRKKTKQGGEGLLKKLGISKMSRRCRRHFRGSKRCR